MNMNLPEVVNAVALISLFSLLGTISLFIYHILGREKRIREKEKSTLAEYQDIIKQAHEQASELLDRTTGASEKIISQVQSTNADMNKNLDKILQSMAEKHIKSLDTEADAFKKEYVDKVVQMEKAVDQKMDQNLDAFATSLNSKVSASAQFIDQKTKDLMLKADKEVEEYKKAELVKIDTKISDFVQKISAEALEINLPPEIQKEIVIKALERAKKEGVFD